MKKCHDCQVIWAPLKPNCWVCNKKGFWTHEGYVPDVAEHTLLVDIVSI